MIPIFMWVLLGIMVVICSYAIYVLAANDAKKASLAYSVYLLGLGVVCGIGIGALGG